MNGKKKYEKNIEEFDQYLKEFEAAHKDSLLGTKVIPNMKNKKVAALLRGMYLQKEEIEFVNVTIKDQKNF